MIKLGFQKKHGIKGCHQDRPCLCLQSASDSPAACLTQIMETPIYSVHGGDGDTYSLLGSLSYKATDIWQTSWKHALCSPHRSPSSHLTEHLRH